MFIYVFGFSLWVIGTISLFAHEVWLWKWHPEEWKNRKNGITTMPDWQVWLCMLFWPIVLVGALALSAGTYISTNATVWFASRKARKKKN